MKTEIIEEESLLGNALEFLVGVDQNDQPFSDGIELQNGSIKAKYEIKLELPARL